MECNYIIKLPNGGEIAIPTNFGTIDKTSEMVEIFESGSNNSALELAQYINSATNGVLTSHDINQTILKKYRWFRFDSVWNKWQNREWYWI